MMNFDFFRGVPRIKRQLYTILGLMMASILLTPALGPGFSLVMTVACIVFAAGASAYLMWRHAQTHSLAILDSGMHPRNGVLTNIPATLREFLVHAGIYLLLLSGGFWLFAGDTTLLRLEPGEKDLLRFAGAATMVFGLTCGISELVAILIVKRWSATPPAHVLFGWVVATWALSLSAGMPLADALQSRLPGQIGDMPTEMLLSLPTLGVFILVLGVWLRHIVVSKWQAELDGQTRLAKDAEQGRKLAEAQLAMLQAQIEPHFLYNTLASVQYLVKKNPEGADFLLTQLIRYLRHAMPKLRATMSTLAQEFELADAFLQIARMRMGGRLTVSVELATELHDIAFPPLVIQTLVENALKHGVEPKLGPVCIKVSALLLNGQLSVAVADNGVGFGRAQTKGTGAGLVNIRDRLQGIYCGRAQLSVRDNGGVGVVSEVMLSMRSNESEGVNLHAHSSPSRRRAHDASGTARPADLFMAGTEGHRGG